MQHSSSKLQTTKWGHSAYVYLTSFKISERLDAHKLSVAVYQPKGFAYPKLGFFDIRNDRGEWIRPRLFVQSGQPLDGYYKALRALYDSRRQDIADWVSTITSTGGHYALCCWCPYDRAAQRQLREHGTFVCHTEVIRRVLEEYRLPVIRDFDRYKMVEL